LPRTVGARPITGKKGRVLSLIKMAFWLSVIIVLAPVDPAPSNSGPATNVALTNGLSSDAVGVARATVSDMASFCDRNPLACETGTRVLDRFGAKAIAVAEYVFNVVSGSKSQNSAAPTPRTVPASTLGLPSQGSSLQNTLQPDDLDAPWVGPIDDDA